MSPSIPAAYDGLELVMIDDDFEDDDDRGDAEGIYDLLALKLQHPGLLLELKLNFFFKKGTLERKLWMWSN